MPITRPIVAVLLAGIVVTGVACEPESPAAEPSKVDVSELIESTGGGFVPVDPESVAPFNGTDFTGWKKFGHANLDKWEVGQPSFAHDKPGPDAPPALVQPALQGVSIYTEREFGDCRIELEAMVPAGGNSGVYIMGEYELQLFDDPNANPDNPTNMDFGAIARKLPPEVWANKGGGVWQTIVIDFRAPRFDADKKKTANARLVRVTLNGKLIHENAEIDGPTAGGLYGEEYPTGPLYLQGNEGPAAFRNIRVTPLDGADTPPAE